MFKLGDKLEINKNFTGVVDILGIYPRGQSDYQETHYELMVNGCRLKLPESTIGGCGLFVKIEPKVEIVLPPAPVEPEKAPEPKKEEKKARKK